MVSGEKKKSAKSRAGALPEEAAPPVQEAAVLPEEAAALPEEAPPPAAEAPQPAEVPAFVDELGVEELTDVLHGHRGRIFSAAGRESPVAEFAPDGVLLRPAQKPYIDAEPGEVIIFGVDPRGVLLNELGQPRKIIGAKFKGQPIFTLAELKPGTVKHYAAWFDKDDKPHKLYVQGQALTSDMIFRIRNRTPDGEIGIFSEITTD